jgi:DNA-binding transcriptional MocR family regulator
MAGTHKTSIGHGFSLPAAEVLSFLKDSRGTSTWTEHDLARTLNVSSAEAQQALAVLQLEGYVEPTSRSATWRTTEQGELVSGGKAPRFTRESVERTLIELTHRIRSVNEDESAPFQINKAVAFGDFLTDRTRVQAAEVGIELQRRKAAANNDHIAATEHG